MKYQKLGESTMKIKRNKDDTLQLELSPIFIAKDTINNPTKLHTTLFAELLHHELHKTTLKVIKGTNSVNAGIQLEEAIVHSITNDWAREIAKKDKRKINSKVIEKDLHPAMFENERYSLYPILYNEIFLKHSGLPVRKQILKEYKNDPLLMYRAFLAKVKN